MLLQLKLVQSPTQVLHTQKPPYITQSHNTPSTLSPPIPKLCSKFSRRELAIFTNSSLLLLTSQTLNPHPRFDARAEDYPQENKGGMEEQETNKGEQQVTNTVEVEQQETNKVEVKQQEPNNSEVEQQETDKVQVEQQETDKVEVEQQEANKGEVKQQETETSPKNSFQCNGRNPTKRAFLEVSIDGKPAGRIVIGLYEENAPVGAGRFSGLVSGKAGITYRRKEFVKIMPNYVQHGGIRSYGVDAELASRTGSNFANDSLIDEWERETKNCSGTKNLTGTVSIIVRDPSKPPPKVKLVARGGKLEIDQEEVGVEPNGTEFIIATRDSPELDSSALVIGKVIEGMDVVEKIGQVKTVQDNTSSPYFRVAKLIGDKRAVVAERGFNRPYSKVIVTNCGLLE